LRANYSLTNDSALGIVTKNLLFHTWKGRLKRKARPFLPHPFPSPNGDGCPKDGVR